MRLNRKQTFVIVFLNVVIAALVAFILLYPRFGKADGEQPSGPDIDGNDVTDPTDTPPDEVYVKLRDATSGAVEEVIRETHIQGSGDETALLTQYVNGTLYIFGNATVSDYDFDSYGGFLCTVSDIGKITSFTYYDGRMTAAKLVNGGFAVATVVNADSDKTNYKLYVTDFSGETIEVASPSAAVEDIITVDGTIAAVITRPTLTSFMLTEYSFGADGKWNSERSTHISSGYTLDYFDCFCLGDKYILAARAYSLPRYDSIVFYTFAAGGDASAHFYGGSSENLMQPYAVMPYANGFIALARRDGVAAIVTVDYAFLNYRRELLGFIFTDARLFFRNDKYYAVLDCPDGSVTYEIDNNVSRKIISAADGVAVSAVINSNGAMLAGKADSALKLTDTAAARALVLDMADVKVFGGYRLGDETVLVLSATGGAALSAPIGGRDIYVIAVNI